jgi:putative FmdB family regulatory protein
MPNYEYRCSRCGHEFEEVQRITAEPIADCPKCGRRSVERLISRTSFILKGTGWYATDYGRKPSGEDGAGKTSPAKPDDGKTAEKKTEAAAEAGKSSAGGSGTRPATTGTS